MKPACADITAAHPKERVLIEAPLVLTLVWLVSPRFVVASHNQEFGVSLSTDLIVLSYFIGEAVGSAVIGTF